MLNLLSRAVFCGVLAIFLADPAFAAGKPPAVDFQREVRPLLAKFCFSCHNDKKQSGDVKLLGLNSDLVKGSDAETWHDVLNKLNKGEMPPKKSPQPTNAQRDTIVKWLTAELKRAAVAKRSTGGRVVLRRMTRYEYANTMRDLLGVNLDFAADLPPESTSPDGFRNNGSTLAMSPLQLEFYLKAARLGLEQAIVIGEKPRTFQSHTEKSTTGNRRNKNRIPIGNRMPPGGLFLAKMAAFPRAGEFVIRVKAAARAIKGQGYPRLSVAIGVRADVLAPKKTAGEIEIDAPLAAPQVYELRGRIEDFPLPGKNPKFPGMLITTTHVGKAKATGKRGKKNKNKNKKKNRNNKQPVKDDPTQPLIVIHSIDFVGPVFDAWPPSSHTRILFASKSSGDEKVYAREVLAKFMRRAFRRPVETTEVERMMTLFAKIRPRVETFEAAMRDVLSVVLISPDFLYLLEPPDKNSGSTKKQPLTDHELATRLSYFLWSTMPDDNLAKLAASRKLRDPAVLGKQVRAMIADKRSWNFVENFTTQWLDLAGLDRVAVNPEFYPNFDDRLKRDMRLEPQYFFAEILKNDLSALNLLDSKFTMLNRPLAKHYGIVGPKGDAFERVALKPEDHRGGLLTQAAVLLTNSTGEESHPIRRAVWLLDRLLGDPPPPPPPDVPELKSDQPDFAGLPLKRQLEIHRTKAACNSCHRQIDPWGVPLENFDAVGLWRSKVVKPGAKKGRNVTTPVDASSTLPGGQQISGVDALKTHLLTHERTRFSRAVVRKMMAYALGRSPEFSDTDTIDRLTKQFAAKGFRLSDLIVAIVQSDEFRMK